MTKHALLLSVMAIMGLGTTAQAEVFKDKGGYSTCVPSSVEDMNKRPDGSVVRKTVFTCITHTDLPFPFDYQKHLCNGTMEFAADGKFNYYQGYCEVLSTKGDRAAYWSTGNPTTGGRWGYINGSGAFAGIKGGGTYQNKATMPGGGGVYLWTGSWQTD